MPILQGSFQQYDLTRKEWEVGNFLLHDFMPQTIKDGLGQLEMVFFGSMMIWSSKSHCCMLYIEINHFVCTDSHVWKWKNLLLVEINGIVQQARVGSISGSGDVVFLSDRTEMTSYQ